MKIIRMVGRLGNQMIYYSYYLYYKKYYGDSVKFDVSELKNLEFLHHWGYAKEALTIDKVFNLEIKTSSYFENVKLRGFYITFLRCNYDLANIEKKIFGKNIFFKKKYFEPKSINELLEKKDSCYISSSPYLSTSIFKKIENEVIHSFNFPKIEDEKNKDIIEKIKKTNSVSIHLRCLHEKDRENQSFEIEKEILFNYLSKAIPMMNKKIKNPYFYIFYDSAELKESFDEKYSNLKNQEFISWNRGEKSYIDLQLMSYCKNNILANSSFSWWGGFLNQNKSKVVIYPNTTQFENYHFPQGSHFKNWICIN